MNGLRPVFLQEKKDPDIKSTSGAPGLKAPLPRTGSRGLPRSEISSLADSLGLGCTKAPPTKVDCFQGSVWVGEADVARVAEHGAADVKVDFTDQVELAGCSRELSGAIGNI